MPYSGAKYVADIVISESVAPMRVFGIANVVRRPHGWALEANLETVRDDDLVTTGHTRTPESG